MKMDDSLRGAAAWMTGIVIWCLMGTAVYAAQATETQSKPQDPGLAKILSMAESQHEIVMILIKQGQFSEAASEADKIFRMEWPGSEEPRLLAELLSLCKLFHQHSQPALGLRLIEKNEKGFKAAKSRAALWKEKGYLYKKMGDDDKALECFRRAQEFEKTSPN